MSEITKLYENAGVKPNYIDACTVEDKYWQNEELANEYGTFDMYMNAKCGHQEDCTTLCSCAYTKEEYPPFTSEKQLRLTTFIGLRYGFQMLKNESFDYIIATRIYVKYEYEYKGYGYGYDEAIANLVNNLWQDLTEKEKQQVKGILE